MGTVFRSAYIYHLLNVCFFPLFGLPNSSHTCSIDTWRTHPDTRLLLYICNALVGTVRAIHHCRFWHVLCSMRDRRILNSNKWKQMYVLSFGSLDSSKKNPRFSVLGSGCLLMLYCFSSVNSKSMLRPIWRAFCFLFFFFFHFYLLTSNNWREIDRIAFTLTTIFGQIIVPSWMAIAFGTILGLAASTSILPFIERVSHILSHNKNVHSFWCSNLPFHHVVFCCRLKFQYCV